jgi:long-chain fatty acid transport protein
MNANVNNALIDPNLPAGYSAVPAQVNGKIIVKDFQWPATFAIGAAFKSAKWMFAADIKQIMWSDVMKDFKMTFVADPASNQSGLGAQFANTEVDVALFQEWDDQTVIQIGGAYQATKQLALRAGFNYGANPIPDTYLNPLFPAIVENHLTLGLGYDIDKNSDVNFSFVYGFESEATAENGDVTVKHSQTNWQFMYSYLF